LNTPDDFSKIARMLSGRAIGLALSGGGARGLAHIGVIRAIQEAHIPIDAVGGTSFGSIVGACLGLEWEWKQIYQAMQKFIRTRSKYFRPALPFVSLIEGHRLSKLFQQYYGFVDLEDLWRPFLCLSANLTQSRLEILNKGPVWSAVRASMSLPGVFPPVLRNNQILVDGGVISNLPSDILKDRIEGGFVISSDTTVDESEFYEYRNDLSSWQILWAHANPRVKADRFPSIAKITAETMALASKWQRPQQLTNTDLLIHIPVEQYKMFDYDAIEELMELGYQKAIEMLQEWEET
jgi:predicted acylesterase/phospholipase RssA